MNARIATVLFLVAALAAPLARAAVVLDQSFLVGSPTAAASVPVLGSVGEINRPPSFPTSLPSVLDVGVVQTFTAGTRGYLDLLAFQAVSITGGGILIATLIDGDVFAGADTVITTGGIDFASLPSLGSGIPPFPTFYLHVRDADYFVEVGQRYSVLFSGLPTTGLARAGLALGHSPRTAFMPIGTNYEGGAYRAIVQGGLAPTASVLDVGFESFVDVVPVSVPAPAAPLTLLAATAVLAGGLALRRRHAGP